MFEYEFVVNEGRGVPFSVSFLDKELMISSSILSTTLDKILVSLVEAGTLPLCISVSAIITRILEISFTSRSKDGDLLLSSTPFCLLHLGYLIPKSTALTPRLTLAIGTPSSAASRGMQSIHLQRFPE